MDNGASAQIEVTSTAADLGVEGGDLWLSPWEVGNDPDALILDEMGETRQQAAHGGLARAPAQPAVPILLPA